MRSTVDKLISWTGLILAAVLLVAGGLLTWASSFAQGQVSNQLSEQQITMPSGAALATPDMKKYLSKYAGQPMTTGAQAEAYADHYIMGHMNEASGGKSYAQVSAAASAAAKSDPTAASTVALQNLKATLFQGNALRSMLLTAYAFGTLGLIAMYASIAAYVGAVLMLILGLLGLRHAKTVEESTVSAKATPELATAKA